MSAEQPLELGEIDLDCLGTVGVYAKKYFALRKKCEQLQQSNEKLVNRLHHVKRMIKKYKKERRLLMGKLDEHGDDYRSAEVTALWDDPQTGQNASSGDGQDAKPFSNTTSSQSLTPGGASLDPSSSTAVSPGGSTKVKKSRAEKGEKESGAPKKPANAFLMYCQQQRPYIQEQYMQEENEEISHPELTRRLALGWNALPQEKKNVYYELYEEEKKKYERELEAYSSTKDIKPANSLLTAIDDTTAGIAAINASLTVKVEPQ